MGQAFKIFKRILLTTFVMGAFYSKASEKCDCQANILMTISKVEENYAGFPDKVAQPRNVEYNALKERLISNSALITDPASCFELLKEYVNFFYDKHFRIEYSAMPDSVVVPIDGKMIEELLNGQNENSIEGIWIDPHGSKIAIMENGKDTFWGVKVASTTDQYPQGFVYFTLARQGNTYSASLYNRKLNIDIPAKKVGNFVKIWNMQLWIRENALLTTLESEEVKSWKENSNGLMFKKINHDFNYLKIPTFENNDREIGSLIALNDSTIRTTPYLVIDLGAMVVVVRDGPALSLISLRTRLTRAVHTSGFPKKIHQGKLPTWNLTSTAPYHLSSKSTFQRKQWMLTAGPTMSSPFQMTNSCIYLV